MAMEAQSAVGSGQRQGRRGGAGTSTSPSSTDSTDTRSGTTNDTNTMGNNARPRDAVHGTENKEGTPTGSDTKDGSK